jgi:hypothetical protein
MAGRFAVVVEVPVNGFLRCTRDCANFPAGRERSSAARSVNDLGNKRRAAGKLVLGRW